VNVEDIRFEGVNGSPPQPKGGAKGAVKAGAIGDHPHWLVCQPPNEWARDMPFVFALILVSAQ
jgi:hypothetical protein